jgi:hypothetical protein
LKLLTKCLSPAALLQKTNKRGSTNGAPFLPYRLKDEINHYNRERKPHTPILKNKHYYHVALLHNTCPEILTVASKGEGKIT